MCNTDVQEMRQRKKKNWSNQVSYKSWHNSFPTLENKEKKLVIDVKLK